MNTVVVGLGSDAPQPPRSQFNLTLDKYERLVVALRLVEFELGTMPRLPPGAVDFRGPAVARSLEIVRTALRGTSEPSVAAHETHPVVPKTD